MKFLYFAFYRLFAFYLPKSSVPIIGSISKKIRSFLVGRLFLSIGENVNIERTAKFGMGSKITIGNNSGIGINASILSNTIIGNDVMMGLDCIIYASNHNFKDLKIPMNKQGHSENKTTVIGVDVLIGGRVIIIPDKRIGNGVIIGEGNVVTKNHEDYGIYEGNPTKFIKSRI